MQASRLALLGIFVAAPVLAQTNGTYLIDVSGVASPSSPTVHVEIRAAWDDPNRGFVFGGGDYDLVADDGLFSNAVANPNLNMSGTNTPGIVQGNRVTGAAIGQLHIPNFGIGLRDNPLLLASYDWTATDFRPRVVSLVTDATDNFIVSDLLTGATTQLFPAQFTPGSGSIVVVPGPAGLLVCVAMGGALVRRQRRFVSGDVRWRRHCPGH